MPISLGLCLLTYPKVYVQVAGRPKFPIADLVGHCHLVILVQGLVEAFPAVGWELDIMRSRGRQQAGRQQKSGGRGHEHAVSLSCRVLFVRQMVAVGGVRTALDFQELNLAG